MQSSFGSSSPSSDREMNLFQDQPFKLGREGRAAALPGEVVSAARRKIVWPFVKVKDLKVTSEDLFLTLLGPHAELGRLLIFGDLKKGAVAWCFRFANEWDGGGGLRCEIRHQENQSAHREVPHGVPAGRQI